MYSWFHEKWSSTFLTTNPWGQVLIKKFIAEELSEEDIKTNYSYREQTFSTLSYYLTQRTYSFHVTIIYKLPKKPRDDAKNKMEYIIFFAFISNIVS